MGVIVVGNWFQVEPLSLPATAVGAEIALHRAAIVEQRMNELLRAAEPASGEVHQLRVACRRMAAALSTFAPLAPNKSRRLRRQLQRLRRAAGPVRDLDVMADRLANLAGDREGELAPLLEDLQRQRRQAVRHLQQAVADAAKPFGRAAARWRRRLYREASRKRAAPFGDLARDALADAARRVLRIDPRDATREELHRLRIAGKRLRYAVELLASGAPATLADEAYPIVEEMQERLGAINDCYEAAARLKQRSVVRKPSGGVARPAEPQRLPGKLAAGQLRQAAELTEEFLAWWNSQRRQTVAVATGIGSARRSSRRRRQPSAPTTSNA